MRIDNKILKKLMIISLTYKYEVAGCIKYDYDRDVFEITYNEVIGEIDKVNIDYCTDISYHTHPLNTAFSQIAFKSYIPYYKYNRIPPSVGDIKHILDRVSNSYVQGNIDRLSSTSKTQFMEKSKKYYPELKDSISDIVVAPEGVYYIEIPFDLINVKTDYIVSINVPEHNQTKLLINIYRDCINEDFDMYDVNNTVNELENMLQEHPNNSEVGLYQYVYQKEIDEDIDEIEINSIIYGYYLIFGLELTKDFVSFLKSKPTKHTYTTWWLNLTFLLGFKTKFISREDIEDGLSLLL